MGSTLAEVHQPPCMLRSLKCALPRSNLKLEIQRCWVTSIGIFHTAASENSQWTWPAVRPPCPRPLLLCGCLLTGALGAKPFWARNKKISSEVIDAVLEWRSCLCDCRNKPKSNMKNKLPNVLTQLKHTHNASNQLSYNHYWESCLW